jgi:phosphoribosyl-ATP pyrophosphohydrolase/phosphoribosyl-AMP cyclohydrolase/histidinol dehydrogenase
MEATVPLPFIVHVDLAGGPLFQEGLTRKQLGYLGCIYFTTRDNEVDQLLGFLQRHVYMQTYVNATNVSTLDSIISILDAGARTVFVQQSRLTDLESYGDRIALATSHHETNFTPSNGHGVLVVGKEDPTACESALSSYAESKTSPIFLYAGSKENTQAYVDQARRYSAIPIIPAKNLTMSNSDGDGSLSVPAVFGAYWMSDRNDHLIPTLVADERGIALGLVYSSQESLSESLKSGRGTDVNSESSYLGSSNILIFRGLSKS